MMTNRIFAGNGAFGRVPLRPCDRVRSFYIASNFAEFVIDQREGFSLPRHYSPPRRRIVSSDSFATRESWKIGNRSPRDPPALERVPILGGGCLGFQVISRILVISRKRNTSARYSGKSEARRCVARGGRVLFGVSRGEGLLIIRQYGLSSFPSYQERGDIEIGNGEAVLPRFNR